MQAMNHNPLQDSLIPELHESTAIFGEPVSKPVEVAKIGSQYEQVKAIMASGQWYTLPALQKELKRRFNALHLETSISARLRGLRKDGFTVERQRTRPDSNLYQYRAVKAASPSPVCDDCNRLPGGSDCIGCLADTTNAEAMA
jgi:hypothetical protein